jgi:class 3 adenylate cyclase
VAELAGGTLTFVFSDVEGSTRLLRQLRDAYGPALAEHQRLLREAVAAHGGHEVDTHGDSFFAAFRHPREAVLAGVAAQRSLAEHAWPEGAELRVRIGVHTGPAEVAEDRYVGLAVHRAARLCAAGHGGQILVSHATIALLEDDEAELSEIELRDLGEHRLKDFDRPVRVYQVVAPGLERASPPLRTEGRPAGSALALRASDSDRDRTVTALREHTAVGRLTLEEFSERVDKATSAVTLAELEEVARDLPAAAPGERPQRRAKRFTGVLFSDTERTGRWRLPRFGLALVLFGNADLDLRQAELGGRTVSLTALVLFGNVDVYVPEGVEVDLGGLAVFGHRREHGRDVAPLPGTPLLRVHIFSLFATADLWRVPLSWGARTFSEVIRAFRREERRELPPGE